MFVSVSGVPPCNHNILFVPSRTQTFYVYDCKRTISENAGGIQALATLRLFPEPECILQGRHVNARAMTHWLRYIYSMPVERIIHLFNENGFDLQKPTAHGLLRKTAMLFENLHKAMRDAVLSDYYIGMDETYKNVLVAEKNSKGKGIRKGYVWNAIAHHLRLTYFFYQDGSRSQDIAHDFLKGYTGAFQSDALRAYRNLEISEM